VGKQGLSRAIAVFALTISLLAASATAFADPDGTGVPTPTPSPKTIKDAKAQVKYLEEQASQVEEDYEQAKIKYDAGKRRVKLLEQDVAAQKAKVALLGERARTIALLQFQNRGIDTTAQIFTSSDPDSFLGQLSTASQVDANMNSALQEHLAQQANLTDLERTLKAEVLSLAAEEKRLAELDKQLDESLKAAKALVEKMTAAELAAMYAAEGGSSSFDASDVDAGGRVKAVISYAVSHVKGAQYVRGASGPKAFDCSGFTLAAYRVAGISLPHSSRSQYSVGRAVSRSDLKPGDLIFWYSPIHHVGLYLGNGMIAHARNPRADLVIQSLASYPAPYTGARRVIG
jgi:cell wall-associated NlpC family hydrolase